MDVSTISNGETNAGPRTALLDNPPQPTPIPAEYNQYVANVLAAYNNQQSVHNGIPPNQPPVVIIYANPNSIVKLIYML